MASTTFTDNVTPVISAWLNDVNSATYTILGNGTSYTGVLTLAGTTDSTSTATGQAIIAGGVGIAKALWVGGLANIAGAVTAQSTLTLSGALTYGGVALSNSVTGTGSMMLSTSPTTTGTLTAAAINASGAVTGTGSFISNITAAASIIGHLIIKRNGSVLGYVGNDASDTPSLLDSAGAARLGWTTSGVATTGTLSSTGNFSVNTNVVSFSASAGANALSLDSSGNLLLGVAASSTTPAQGIVNFGNSSSVTCIGHANGTASGNGYAIFAYNGGLIGSITQSGTTAVLYNTTSDYRIKTLSGLFSASGSIIDAVPVHSGVYTADGGAERALFLAHEVQAYSPASVTGEKDAVDADGKPLLQQLDHSSLVPILWAEVRALRGRLSAANIA